ncbi:unnamed protein product, partial [Allacma fusca]
MNYAAKSSPITQTRLPKTLFFPLTHIR